MAHIIIALSLGGANATTPGRGAQTRTGKVTLRPRSRSVPEPRPELRLCSHQPPGPPRGGCLGGGAWASLPCMRIRARACMRACVPAWKARSLDALLLSRAAGLSGPRTPRLFTGVSVRAEPLQGVADLVESPQPVRKPRLAVPRLAGSRGKLWGRRGCVSCLPWHPGAGRAHFLLPPAEAPQARGPHLGHRPVS